MGFVECGNCGVSIQEEYFYNKAFHLSKCSLFKNETSEEKECVSCSRIIEDDENHIKTKFGFMCDDRCLQDFCELEFITPPTYEELKQKAIDRLTQEKMDRKIDFGEE